MLTTDDIPLQVARAVVAAPGLLMTLDAPQIFPAQLADIVIDKDTFFITSSPRGELQRAGVSLWRILEVRGSVEWLFCAACRIEPWPAGLVASTDEACCPQCGASARLNVPTNSSQWAPSCRQEEGLMDWVSRGRAKKGSLVWLRSGAWGPAAERGCRIAQHRTHVSVALGDEASATGEATLGMSGNEEHASSMLAKARIALRWGAPAAIPIAVGSEVRLGHSSSRSPGGSSSPNA